MRTKENKKMVLNFGVCSCLSKEAKNIEICQNVHTSDGMQKLLYKREQATIQEGAEMHSNCNR